MIFDICHMDMLSVYGVLCLHNCCLEWLWIESFKNMVLSSLSLQEPYLLLRTISFLLKGINLNEYDIYICHMDMLNVYGVLCLHNCCLEWLWIELFKNLDLSSLSLQES